MPESATYDKRVLFVEASLSIVYNIDTIIVYFIDRVIAYYIYIISLTLKS